MSGRVFLDTNVLVYLFDADAPVKQRQARAAIAAIHPGELVISTQILLEFFVVVTRKLAVPRTAAEAEEDVRQLCAHTVVSTDAALVQKAIATSRTHQLSVWDALVIEAASGAGCSRLLTEDLQHGQTLRGVRVENPFVGGQ